MAVLSWWRGLHRRFDPSRLQLLFVPRVWSRGGGIGSVTRTSLSTSILFKPLDYRSFEAVETRLSFDHASVVSVCLYRPPPSKWNKLTNSASQQWPAYKQNHSTETAALRVLGGLLGSADDRLVSLVALRDLSAAFHTLDHSILLKLLETTYGVRGTVIDWFVSYQSDCFQSVILGGVVSASRPLEYGVPQGSVLGPVLFILYYQPQMWFLSIIVTITSTEVIMNCPKGPHPISSFLLNPVFRHVLMMSALDE